MPLLAGCAASYLASTLVMKNSLMTEKIIRRGVATTHEYTADLLAQVTVREVAAKKIVTLSATQTVGEVRNWFTAGSPDSRFQGFPILDESKNLVGVVTRRDLLNPEIHGNKQLKDLPPRLPKFVYEECTVRQAVDHMVRHDIGRLPVMTHDKPPKLVGMVTRSDILSAFKRGLDESTTEAPTLKIPGLRRRKPALAARDAVYFLPTIMPPVANLAITSSGTPKFWATSDRGFEASQSARSSDL